MRIFFDANVLFSAAKADGAIAQLAKLLMREGYECWVDDYVVEEARRNLAAKAPERIAALDALIAHLRVAAAATPSGEPDVVRWLPEKDRPVLAAAIRLRCTILVTGDRTHFGAGYGKSFAGVTVHSPRSLAEALLKD